MGVVLIHPNMLMGSGGAGSKEMSGRFLRLACGPMLNLVDELRESCWWPHLQALIGMVLRIVGSRGAAELKVPNAEEMVAMAAKLSDGAPLALSALWGDAFELSPEEAKASAEAAGKAKTDGLISDETATRYVAGPFGILDVAAERDAIDKAAQEAADEAMALMAATPVADGEDGADGPPVPPGKAPQPKTKPPVAKPAAKDTK
jgi:hypothetical protein